MDRFYVDGSDKKLIYQEALEFMGDVRAGISRERFSMGAVRYADAFIDMLNDTEGVRQFLSLKGISLEYVHKHVKGIFARLHFNQENDHYLTLCLPRSASEAQINRRWKDLMLIYHPDRSKDVDAAGCAKRINEAYNVLKHPDKKREYDMRMTTSAVAHFGSHRKKALRPQGAQRYLFISPGMRRLLPRLIIPCCIAISSIILLVIFLDNRPAPSLTQAAASHKARKSDGRKPDVAPTPGKKDMDIGSQEAAPSAEYRRFYKEEQATHAPLENTIKRKTVRDFNTHAVPASTPGELAEVNEHGRAVTAGFFERGPLRETEFARTEHAAPAEAPASNKITEKGASDRQLQKSPSPGLEAGATGRGPKGMAEDIALNERYGGLETEVFLFLVGYIQAYEEGDITKFMGFFSRSALENGNMRYEDIRRAYKKNFESSRYSYTLKNVDIKSKDSAVVARGDYSIKKITGEDKGHAINGKMHWTLGRENGNLKIVRMDYDRR